MSETRYASRIATLSSAQKARLYRLLRNQSEGSVRMTAHDRLIAYYHGGGVEAGALKAHLASRLPEYMVPAILIAVDTIPRTPNGKTDRDSLRFIEMPARAPEAETIGSPIMGQLQEIWKDLLRVDHVGAEDNFFDLGGHSLLVLKCVNRINDLPGCHITPAEFFRAPTISGILNQIGSVAQPDAFEFVHPIREGGSGPAVFVIYSPRLARGLSRHLGEEYPCFGIRLARVDAGGARKEFATLTDMVSVMVSEIDAARPEGELVICGYSFGAMLAYEAAQQLQRRGRKVKRLILLDPTPPHKRSTSKAPGSRKDVAPPVSRSRVKWLQDNSPLKPLFWKKLHDLLIVKPRRKLTLLEAKRRLKRGAPLSSAMARAYDMDFFFHLWKGYRMEPYEGAATLFHAVNVEQDASRAWSGYLLGETRVFPMAGDHFEFVSSERSPELIRLFTEDLESR